MVMKDDDLKRTFGLDADRVGQAYVNANGLDGLQVHLNSGYLMPCEIELRARQEDIKAFLQSGKLRIVVPMRERGPVIRPLLATLVGGQQVAPGNILVVDDGSDDDALNEVRRYGKDVRLVFRDDILDVLDWPRLLQILNLTGRPRGKGVSVLAAYLDLYFAAKYLGRNPTWIGQNDAEIAEFHRYRCWEHLGFGVVTQPDAKYVKTAKFGRTNERCMTARWMLLILAQAENVAPEIRKRAGEIAWRLGGHKWMLTGEFALRWELAMSRPFATGYLEETLISLFVEDRFARPPMVNAVIQVGNPNPRLDAANDDRKESLMQQQISNFLLMAALEGVLPVDQWDVETIARLNRTAMAKPLVMGWIPPNEGPVVAEAVRNDRIIPSVTQLDKAGLIDWEKAERLFAP